MAWLRRYRNCICKMEVCVLPTVFVIIQHVDSNSASFQQPFFVLWRNECDGTVIVSLVTSEAANRYTSYFRSMDLSTDGG